MATPTQFVPSAPIGSKASHILPGCLVALKGQDAVMVVEALRSTTFGTLAQCCRFQSDDQIWSRDVPLTQLEIRQQSASAPQVGIGTEVRLRPDGPVMTVLDTGAAPDGLYALCEWDGARGIVRRRLFPVTGLTLSLLESF